MALLVSVSVDSMRKHSGASKGEADGGGGCWL